MSLDFFRLGPVKFPRLLGRRAQLRPGIPERLWVCFLGTPKLASVLPLVPTKDSFLHRAGSDILKVYVPNLLCT